MVGMADAAFMFFQAAVTTPVQFEILGDIFMAIVAQTDLRGFIETGMAFVAIRLDLGMALDNRARH